MTCAYFTVLNCESVLRKLTYKFIGRLEQRTNRIIGAINSSDIRFQSKTFVRIKELLDEKALLSCGSTMNVLYS